MIFKAKDYTLSLVEYEDINGVIEVYNSNKDFLKSHMDVEEINNKWMLEELETMNRLGFQCCKIVNSGTCEIVGVLDFKINKETYLSLLMIHKGHRYNGLGNIIYKAFEEYVQAQNSISVRIDVVTEYDSAVLDFWIGKGFVVYENIELNWAGKVLPAVTLKKLL